MLYRDFATQEALDAQYDVEGIHPDFDSVVGMFLGSSETARNTLEARFDVRSHSLGHVAQHALWKIVLNRLAELSKRRSVAYRQNHQQTFFGAGTSAHVPFARQLL